MRKVQIKHRETGEYISAYIDSEGVITLENGRIADLEVWSYDEPVDWIGGVIVMAVSTFVLFAMGSAIVFFTEKYKDKKVYTSEQHWMRDCLQTASEQECKSQWFVMQRDK